MIRNLIRQSENVTMIGNEVCKCQVYLVRKGVNVSSLKWGRIYVPRSMARKSVRVM